MSASPASAAGTGLLGFPRHLPRTSEAPRGKPACGGGRIMAQSSFAGRRGALVDHLPFICLWIQHGTVAVWRIAMPSLVAPACLMALVLASRMTSAGGADAAANTLLRLRFCRQTSQSSSMSAASKMFGISTRRSS